MSIVAYVTLKVANVCYKPFKALECLSILIWNYAEISPVIRGSSPCVADYLVWNEDEWYDTVSLGIINPAINENLKKFGGKTGSVGRFAPNRVLYSRPKVFNQEIGTCATDTIGQLAKKFFVYLRLIQ